MKTVSINVSTLCVPCENRCRYCLLSYDGKIMGADYDRSAQFSRRFYEYIGEHRPELSFQFYFGYSMEHPRLLDAIDFAGQLRSASGEFLQLDGLKFRDAAQCDELFGSLKEHGIRAVDLTFYGKRDYHDKFAARTGDFDYLMRLLRSAKKSGITVNTGIPVTEENAAELGELTDELKLSGSDHMYVFVPHSEGRGVHLNKIRLTEKSYSMMADSAKAYFNRNKFKSEREWLSGEFSKPEKRMLCLNLAQDNIGQFEKMDFGEIIAYLEELDDAYYKDIPDIEELAGLYGDKCGSRFYSQRDLYLTYQRKYIHEKGLNIYDMNDERHHFSRRY